VRRTALKEINQKLASATLDDERTVLLAEKRAVQLELEQLSANFESIATGIDLQAFEMTQAENFDLQTEVQKLIQPLIEELKEATEPPRQMGPPSAARTSGGCRRLP
jgi:DNA-directed RNA polymerase